MTTAAPTSQPSAPAELLGLLGEASWLEPIDLHFARLACSVEQPGASQPLKLAPLATLGQSQVLVALGAAVASRSLREGHTCAPLAELAGREVRLEDGSLAGRWPALEPWLAALAESPAVANESDQSLERVAVPLVLGDDLRLSLHRYFEHERRLAGCWAQLGTTFALSWSSEDHTWLQARLDHYFPPPAAGEDRQRWAAERCLLQRSLVISGGPGTGKTSTVVKILALLVELAQRRHDPAPRMLLLAPTGKAAARLTESIRSAKANQAMPASVASGIVEQASTIHRALGTRQDSATRFRYGLDRPLQADLVLVDEASMVDLALMRHLVEAVPSHARLVLLGDRHQLASVEAGSVLAELCSLMANSSRMVELLRSYRFLEGSGIAALSGAVRDADAEAALDVLASNRQDLRHLSGEQAAQQPAFRELVVEGYRPALEETSPERVLERFGEFRVLCGHRRGRQGVERLNLEIQRWLIDAALLPASASQYYRGRLILVTKNDYGVGLRNGDVGLVWPDESGRLAVFFAEGEGVRRLSPAHLPEHETAFALTVHKSQGSEYDRIALVCPQAKSPLATRELLYTGITRARHQAVVVGESHDVAAAVRRGVTRHSGLAQAFAVQGNSGMQGSSGL